MWEGIDKRRFPRANYKCEITIAAGREKKPISSLTENVGVGGICASLTEDVGIFSEVDLILEVKKNHPPIKCKGTVVWVVKRTDPKGEGHTTYDTGIEFVDIKRKDRELIVSLINGLREKEENSK